MLLLLIAALAAFVWFTRRDAVAAALAGDGDDGMSDKPEDGDTVDGYVNGVATPITVARIDDDGHVLRTDAAAAFIDMKAAAAADGVELKVNSAWRSNDSQAALRKAYEAGTGNLAAPPGYSNHQSGIDVDVESGGGKNAAFAWMTANASRFGFHRTVSSEPWHWEYSGALPAKVMA